MFALKLFIAEENETANEFDFRKALELLNYLEDPFEARHKIWCAAILRDNWSQYDTNTAVDYIQNLLFFKLIELCHLMGMYWVLHFCLFFFFGFNSVLLCFTIRW